jgi:hypothetical protein
MRVWRLMTHHKLPEDALRIYLAEQYIALAWGAIGDLQKLQAASHDELATVIKSFSDYRRVGNAAAGGRCLWAFHHEMEAGDLVILATPKGRMNVVTIDGYYSWTPQPDPILGAYQHRRPATQALYDPDMLWKKAGGAAPTWSPRWPLVLCAKSLQ